MPMQRVSKNDIQQSTSVQLHYNGKKKKKNYGKKDMPALVWFSVDCKVTNLANHKEHITQSSKPNQNWK